jgi:hypothetical protein
MQVLCQNLVHGHNGKACDCAPMLRPFPYMQLAGSARNAPFRCGDGLPSFGAQN